jgi:hypothetical protein
MPPDTAAREGLRIVVLSTMEVEAEPRIRRVRTARCK